MIDKVIPVFSWCYKTWTSMMPSTCTHKGCQQKRSLTGGQTNDRKKLSLCFAGVTKHGQV